MDPDIIGSVLFDIFAPPSQFADYEQFCRRVNELGAKVSIKKTDTGKEFIRVHNDNQPIPYLALDYAHNWADLNCTNHAYR